MKNNLVSDGITVDVPIGTAYVGNGEEEPATVYPVKRYSEETEEWEAI